MPREVIDTLQKLDELAERISQSAAETALRIAELAAAHRGLALLHALRFEPHGRQPLGTEPLNLIEQLNQTFTYLASLAGTRFLFREFPAHAPYKLNLGPTAGPDIISSDGQIAAEVFAAVDPENNQKLSADIEKVRSYGAVYRFVFYYCPGCEQAIKTPPHPEPVTIVSLGSLTVAG
jgi:hypothetical protein